MSDVDEFHPVIDHYLELLDRGLSGLIAAYSSRPNAIVLSDHRHGMRPQRRMARSASRPTAHAHRARSSRTVRQRRPDSTNSQSLHNRKEHRQRREQEIHRRQYQKSWFSQHTARSKSPRHEEDDETRNVRPEQRSERHALDDFRNRRCSRMVDSQHENSGWNEEHMIVRRP